MAKLSFYQFNQFGKHGMNVTTKTHHALDGVANTAIYSKCNQYRYILKRIWDSEKPPLVFLMLNPSTATEQVNDPTVARCEKRARMWHYGGLIVLNIFAFRATEPKDMMKQDDPIGKFNNSILFDYLSKTKPDDVVCGWGTHGSFRNREENIFKMFDALDMPPRALKWTKGGHPQHPLYVGYNQTPKENYNG